MADAKQFKLLRPSGATCKPILMIGLPSGGEWAEYLAPILIHDLLYSSKSTYPKTNNDHDEAAWKKLSLLDGSALLDLTQKHNGTVILSEDDVLDQRTGDVDMARLQKLEKGGEYQAIIVDDTCFIREPDIASFVMKQYADKGSSVVIMALEGIFDLSAINSKFKVNWKLSAYTKRTVQLTDIGKDVIGEKAFPLSDGKYTKANFVVGGLEMFKENPFPGSPVVSSLGKTKSVSYFGFVNPSDVSYGAILLKLCYAKTGEGTTAETQEAKEVANDNEESSVAETSWSQLWMAFFIAAFFFMIEFFFRMNRDDGASLSDGKSEL